MSKARIEEINYCDECPFTEQDKDDPWGGSLCSKTGDPVETVIPDWCPLPDYDVYEALETIVEHLRGKQ